MLLPSGPDMVRGLYCTGPEARQKSKIHVTASGIGSQQSQSAIRSQPSAKNGKIPEDSLLHPPISYFVFKLKTDF
jgi:hypothetical protein